jgi:hypothetical protein
MFPTGLVGVALLVLRFFVAATTIINAMGSLALGTPPWVLLGFVLASLFLCLGLLTPYFSLLSALLGAGVFVYVGGDPFRLTTSIVGCGIVSVLGPGAYSVDSRIFGRRLLELPPKK